VTVHRDKFPYNKTNKMHQFLKFILEMKLCTFQTVPLSIIRSYSLYTQQRYMSYSFVGSSRAGSGYSILCPSSRIIHCTLSNGICHTGLWAALEQEQDVPSSVHHHELFTVHSAMVYVIQVCGQLSNRNRMFHPAPARKLPPNLYDTYNC
jgi:hypothetical protein